MTPSEYKELIKKDTIKIGQDVEMTKEWRAEETQELIDELVDDGNELEVLEDFIKEHIETLLVKPSSINGIVSPDLPPNRKMEQITSSFYQIEKSQLDQELKDKITAKLDDILASYLEESKIIEKIDNPSRPMHLRAMMLVGMCQSEMLPKGKASNIARDVITEHLKKPNFNTELVAQVDEGEKDKVIERFQSQLKRAGISN